MQYAFELIFFQNYLSLDVAWTILVDDSSTFLTCGMSSYYWMSTQNKF